MRSHPPLTGFHTSLIFRRSSSRAFKSTRLHFKCSVTLLYPTPSIATMADLTTSAAASLPQPPTTGMAPGLSGYENGSQSHMPPPLNIPQNNSMVSSIQTPLGMQTHDITSPTSAGGFMRRAAPEPNKRALYVGGLDPRVTEDVLKQIFETTGHVQNVKIIPDKNVSHFCM